MPDFYHDDCRKKIESKLGCKLTSRELNKKTINEDREREVTVVTLISKEHNHNCPNIGDAGFLFQFNSHHKNSLLIFNSGYVGLGCGSKNCILIFTREDFFEILDSLSSVKKERLVYFIRVEKRNGEFFVDTRNPEVGFISVQNYLI